MAKGELDHVCCEKARLRKAAAPGNSVHGTVQSHLNITKGPGFKADNVEGSFRPGVSVKGRDKEGYG